MYRIIDKRGSGKSSRLMLLAKETGATVVCNNPNRMREKAHAYGITGITFMSYYDFLNTNEAIGKYLIDEIEVFTQSAFLFNKGELVGYTITEDE